ncbi:MAG: DNA translocase FtsK [Patescibacteria group bacterium]
MKNYWSNPPYPEHSDIIEKTLDSYGIRVRVAEINILPNGSVQYGLEITQGTKIEDIEKRKRELALALASSTGTIKIQAPIPGKALIGIVVPKPRIKEMKKENESSSFPKTILGKVLSKLAEILGITAYILYYSSERFEKNKNIARQIIVVIVVPVALTILLDGSLNVSKIFNYFFASFITWIFILGLQQKDEDKKIDKKKVEMAPTHGV